ncbi:hypothetical protein EST38_g7553 [Candolleomyces aberdarensis]|uniref:Uncharacterized protein n=1 Tax=Candolleomyces aberdarensis TaxID=2316362 RepID=A0A4Q2DGU4_9AGAR|nr:hypothetical protein EST38_g7553 [Candolleomyces aberdarensis]
MEARYFLHLILAAFVIVFVLRHVAGAVFIIAFVLNHVAGVAFITAFVLDNVASAAFFVFSSKKVFILSEKEAFFVCFIFVAGGCGGK